MSCHHVAKVDSDAEPDAAVLRHLGLSIPPSRAGPQLRSALHPRTGELRRKSIARVLYDAAMVLLDLWIHEIAEVGLKAFVRALLIGTHQPRVSRDISRQDRGKTAGCSHYSRHPALRRPSNMWA
jgi:hypothetical protein